MVKYIITYYIEKLHRHCFDFIYIQRHKITLKDRLNLRLLDLCQYLIPDYREYLKDYTKNQPDKYLRYKSYI